ncbi:glutamyl-tRNA synthetase [Artomyces pyxidatus]|uniref:Glutamyl-tRNA synthetase n=1 Tax=Artomyces pyxidatus TaxID=48021 RepID=A0ACB8T421_9AGAM|nr:glutamyl-tRNA synthetase [Artomyces pyxidatus]
MQPLLRFAPSPTGPLHLGGLRTALLNHIFARKLGGKWILRIEDTDAARSVPGSVQGIQKGLEWAGLDYDYGPGKHGPHGPYFQSERLDLYRTYSDRLLESGHAYRCFCSADRLAQTREHLARAGLNSTYDKRCLSLTEEEVARRLRAGEKNIVRLNDSNIPSRPSTTPDIIFGHLRDAHASLPTDPVLLKSDLFPTYHLASVVDDHEMGITHVLRGEEWLPSLPLHLDLYASLALKPPQFAHLPLLLNPDGTKMSKRKGDVQIEDYIQRGWEPEAVLNWLALAGWGVHGEHAASPSSTTSRSQNHAPDSTKVMSLAEIIQDFDLSALTHRRTVLDPFKLEYLNKHHLMKMYARDDELQALAERIHPLVKETFPQSSYTTVPYIKQAILVLQGRLVTLLDLPNSAPYLFIPPSYNGSEPWAMMAGIPPADGLVVLDQTKKRLAIVPDWNEKALADALHEENDASGLNSRAFMTVLRHALSGMKSGPSVPEIVHILGRERTIERLEHAAKAVWT